MRGKGGGEEDYCGKRWLTEEGTIWRRRAAQPARGITGWKVASGSWCGASTGLGGGSFRPCGGVRALDGSRSLCWWWGRYAREENMHGTWTPRRGVREKGAEMKEATKGQ